MIVRRTTLLALPLVAILVAAAVGRSSGAKPYLPPPRGPDSTTQPLLDGCARSGQGPILRREVPNWVYVGGNANEAQQTAVTGVAQSKYAPELAAHPTGVDDPATHTSYDYVFNLRVDQRYGGLLGTANYEGRSDETGRLHTERETGTFPVFAWPDRGDRISLVGSWVWDCDHTGPTGEHTEIHPHRILWVERNPGGPSPRSAAGDREADLFATNAATPADTHAICASRTKGDRPAFKQCVATPVGSLPLPAADFTLRAPPRPSKTARLVYRVVDRGSTGTIRVRRVGRGISVHVNARDGAQPVVIAKQIFLGWRPVPRRLRPVHVRVRLRDLFLREALDPQCSVGALCPADSVSTRVGQLSGAPDEWNVFVDAGGIWSVWPPSVLRLVRGEHVRAARTIDFYVARGKPWRLFVYTRECDVGAIGNAYDPNGAVPPCPHVGEISQADDLPGYVADHFRSAAASVGVHRSNARLDGSTCPRRNTHGCYRLTYEVSILGKRR